MAINREMFQSLGAKRVSGGAVAPPPPQKGANGMVSTAKNMAMISMILYRLRIKLLRRINITSLLFGRAYQHKKSRYFLNQMANLETGILNIFPRLINGLMIYLLQIMKSGK